MCVFVRVCVCVCVCVCARRCVCVHVSERVLSRCLGLVFSLVTRCTCDQRFSHSCPRLNFCSSNSLIQLSSFSLRLSYPILFILHVLLSALRFHDRSRGWSRPHFRGIQRSSASGRRRARRRHRLRSRATTGCRRRRRSDVRAAGDGRSRWPGEWPLRRGSGRLCRLRADAI